MRALRVESTVMHYDAIKAMKSKVTELTESVNKLEKLVDKVGEDVELVDQQLTEAEACMPINKEGPLNSILKPFFVSLAHNDYYYTYCFFLHIS